MLGARFLEISVHTPAIRESLEFYESLGFVQARVGETWPHPYAVVTDGRLFLGLHAAFIRSPALTFVMPELARGVEALRRRGVHFEQERFGEDVFNQAMFCDPGGHSVNLLEARTFSPPQLDAPVVTSCGYWVEYGLPARAVDAARAFWESMGFVAMDEETAPFARTSLTSDFLNLGLYRTRAFRQPLLAFEGADMPKRLARLRERGFKPVDEMPDSLDDSANGVLVAPEGTRLLLLQSAE